jgi:hypothetical protein
MDALFFLLALGAFTLLRGISPEKRAELLLRFEYKLHEWGFIDYPNI